MRFGEQINIFWKSWEYHFQDCGQHELWWMDPVLSDLLIFQYSEQKAPKALLTDSAIVSPRLYLNKKSWMSLSDFQRNAQETFVLTMLIRCTKGTLSNIEHTLHWSGTSVIKELIYIIGDHQILHKLGNFGQNNVVEIIIMNGVTEYVIHRLFSGQSTRFHNWNENIVDSSKYFQHFICLVQTSYESRTVIFQKFPQCDSWE